MKTVESSILALAVLNIWQAQIIDIKCMFHCQFNSTPKPTLLICA